MSVKTYYIAAPANFASGGPELLHQLAYKLVERGCKVEMVYFPLGTENPVHENYIEYGLKHTQEIEDSNSSLLIVPETMTDILGSFERVKKAVWWQSVDNYFLRKDGIKGKINRNILKVLGSQNYFFLESAVQAVDLHLVQSKYAFDFLSERGLGEKTLYLTDYLHKGFIGIKTDLSNKADIIAYNPHKGKKFTTKLIAHCPEYKFVPIQNMTREQVVELLQRSKVYIDFGFHPGRDRIPREAAILKNVVVTGLKGSAGNQIDLPISSENKFKDESASLEAIKIRLKQALENFGHEITGFEDYIAQITEQEKVFESEVDTFMECVSEL